MKTITQILLFALLSYNGYSQTNTEFSEEEMYGVHADPFRDDPLYLTDSTFNYVIDTLTGVTDSISKSINVSFNNYGQIIETIDYTKDTNISKWKESKRTVFSYDDEGHALEKHIYLWNDSLGAWGNDEQRFYTPDDFGSAETLVQKWNKVTNEWINDSRQFAQFLNVGKPEHQWREKWDILTATWKKEWRMDFAYDGEEKLTAQLFSKWDAVGWKNHNQTFFFYDDDGNIDKVYINAWYNDTWHKIAKLVFRNPIYNEWQEMTHYIWNSVDSLWGVYKMQEREFDNEGKLMIHKHKTWVVDHWAYTFANAMSYDEDGNKTLFELLKYNNAEWIAVSGSKFFVSDHHQTTGVEDHPSGLSYLLPNPYQGQPILLSLENDRKVEVRLYDLNGRIHFRRKINQTTSFCINQNLPAGIYFLGFFSHGELIKTEKLIIQGL